VGFNDPFADAQAKTTSSEFPGSRLIRPEKSIKYSFLILFGNANACIRDDDLDELWLLLQAGFRSRRLRLLQEGNADRSSILTYLIF
jgi:hypothetical protein